MRRIILIIVVLMTMFSFMTSCKNLHINHQVNNDKFEDYNPWWATNTINTVENVDE